jgi:hypothetical protein
MKIVDCRDNVADQFCKWPLYRRRAPDDDIIVSRPEVICGSEAHGFFPPPPDAIALNRSADFSGDCEADARRPFIVSPPQLDDGALRSPRQRASRGQEIPPSQKALHSLGPLLRNELTLRQSRKWARPQAERRLRLSARRRRSTLRPPFVAMRARKPWRRLRMSLLGW